MTTRQYARLVSEWIASIGLDPHVFGTHSLRRTKATLIYRRTGNLRAVQLLLGHRKIESTVRYLGIEVDDALTIAEQVDICDQGQSGQALPGPPGPDLTHYGHCRRVPGLRDDGSVDQLPMAGAPCWPEGGCVTRFRCRA
jgi:Phage integrase family